MNGKKKWFCLDERALANLIVVLIAISFYLLISHLDVIHGIWNIFLGVAMPFLIGFAIAYLLNGPTNYFETHVFGKLKCRRSLAVLVVYVLFVALLAILVQLILPQMISSIVSLYYILQTALYKLGGFINELAVTYNIDQSVVQQVTNQFMLSYGDIVSQASTMASRLIPTLLSMGVALGSGVVSGVISAITTVISSIYMLLSKNILSRQAQKLTYAILPVKKANHFLAVCSRANRIFSGFLNGKILDSAIIGVLCFFLTVLLRIDFAVLISVVIGVTNIIPFFGPIVGAIPCIFILLIVDPWQALRFAILVLGLQQFDGNILGPKILGDSTGISAFWVLISIVIGGGLFGFPGMLLGVPTFAVIYSLVGDWVRNRLRSKGIDAPEGSPVTPPPEE